MQLPTLHVITPFHNVPAQRFSVCAFAQKARRFPAMMQKLGYRVVEYSNEGSESAAEDPVVILSENERELLFPEGTVPTIGSPGWNLFHGRLQGDLEDRIHPGDIVVHTYGRSHADLVREIPAIHTEQGVGYSDSPFGAYRIYESEAWRHYHWGFADAQNIEYMEKTDRSLSWVIPMPFDLAEWPVGDGAGDEKGPYLLLMGRLQEDKGLEMVASLATCGIRVKLVGPGDLRQWKNRLSPMKRFVEVLPPVTGLARADLMGKARAMLMPTQYVEPFGASGVEGMLCGTPLLASAWGGFLDTVTPRTGHLCRTIDDYLDGLDMLPPREGVAAEARARFSTEWVGKKYDAVFREIGRR